MTYKTTTVTLATALFTAALATPSLAIEKPDTIPLSGKIDWVFDYEEGKQRSRESDKPMFVVFRCER